MDSVFFVFEMIGVVAFALSGAMWAIRNEMDVLGVCVLGATTAVGGGILRDLMLGITPPTMLVNPTAALIAVGVSVLVFLPFTQRLLRGSSHLIYERLMLLADSIGLTVFTVMGVNVGSARLETQSIFACSFLGVLTGVGGGVMRDVMSRSKPYIFVKHFYACAAIIGALVCAVLNRVFGELLATVIGFVLILTLRLLAATFHWRLPKYTVKQTANKRMPKTTVDLQNSKKESIKNK